MTSIKTYLVFQFDHYYPCGGWNDFRDSFENWSKAREFADTLKGDNCTVQIVDRDTGEVIETI